MIPARLFAYPTINNHIYAIDRLAAYQVWWHVGQM